MLPLNIWKLSGIFCFLLAIFTGVAAIVKGAWWHIFSVFVLLAMAGAFYETD